MKKRDLRWLGSLSLSTGKYPSLTAMEFLMEKLGHPEKQTHFIHVAGTNGKGSVTEMMAKILEKAGYRTGKFLSPHLIRFNERIQVNGREATNEELEGILAELDPLLDEYEEKYGVDATLFEIETTMALVYYARQKCDFVVLEVGMGGKYDCTNIVTADVSIIVSIGYDHMNVLGESLAEIAAQKAGIIKAGGKVVTGVLPEEAEKVVREQCEKMGAERRIARPEKTEIVKNARPSVRVSMGEFQGLEVPLAGRKQGENTAICLESVRFLREMGWEISTEAVRKGLAEVVHHGRFEVMSEKPQVIFDGGHNLPAMENFWQNVEDYYPEREKVFIMSLLKYKDGRGVLSQLLKPGVKVIFTAGNDAERYKAADELLEIAQEINPEGEYYTMDLREALELVKQGNENEVAFVVGSFYIYGDVVAALKG